MNDDNKYILDAIKTKVWSGFYSADEVHEMIDEMLEGEDADADAALLHEAVSPEFEKKAEAESSWPEQTDCDRLDDAFDKLNASGIIALHNAGYTLSDGQSDVSEVLHERDRNSIQGYCFYHGQDLERAVNGDGLMIAFGDIEDDKAAKAEIGKIVRQVLQNAGFTVEWNGDPEVRMNIPKIDWKRRASA